MADLGTNIWGSLEAMRDSLKQRIEDAGLEEPCLVAVMPGQEVSLDYCEACTNGMAWVRLVTVARLEDESATTSMGTCASGFTAIFEMGWMRGGPTIEMDNTGSVISTPEAPELDHAAIHQMSDLSIMLNAICAARLPTGWKAKTTGYVPFGPQGGCYGGLWSISVPVE